MCPSRFSTIELPIHEDTRRLHAKQTLKSASSYMINYKNVVDNFSNIIRLFSNITEYLLT
jgi:hypothetical protein